MIIANKKSQLEILSLIPSILNNMSQWKIVEVVLPSGRPHEVQMTQDELLAHFESKEGVLLRGSSTKIVMIVKLGISGSKEYLKDSVERCVSSIEASVYAKEMTKSGLAKIRVNLTTKHRPETDFANDRELRSENIFMVIDDDFFIRKTMEKILSKYGRVITVDNVDDASRLYAEYNPDITFIDAHMPEHTGVQVIKTLAEIDPAKHVIIISGDTSEDTVVDALSNGASAFLAKPFNTSRLVEKMRACQTVHFKAQAA